MTRQRNDKHSTEFGLWIRKQKELDSALGYVATNLDYVWGNYKTGQWILIEEKRFMAEPTYSQSRMFKHLDKVCQYDKNYHGFHLLQFEKTSPEDGTIFLDRVKITKDELVCFLKTLYHNNNSYYSNDTIKI